MAKSSKATRRKLQAGLGDSWDDANLSADNDASTENHSEIELEPSDNELVQGQDMDPPHARTQCSLSKPGSSNSRASALDSHGVDLTPGQPRAAQSLSQSEQIGPSFIMPKLESSHHSSAGSPSRRSKVRSQNIRNRTPHLRTSDRSATSYTPSSARTQPDPMPPSQQHASASRRQQSPASRKQQGPVGKSYLELLFDNFVSPVFRYTFGVFGHAMSSLQPLFGLALAFGVLFFGVQWALVSVQSGLTAALSPVCLIPGSSYVVPFCASMGSDESRADFEGLLHAQSGLEDILDSAKEYTTLPATIKDSELAIRDLRTLVKHSQLPSRNQLELEFDYFIETAGEASADLSRFNSKIGAMVDRIIISNTWTRNVLDGLAAKEASRGAIDHVYNAFARPFVAAPKTLQELIHDQYVEHIGSNTKEISTLIEHAVALLSILQNLDARLDTIWYIAVSDDATITKDQEELLAQLWTKLGGNNSKVKKYNKHLRLLRDISSYRKQALKHVTETLLKLSEIQNELENLAEGVAAPEVLGYREGLPITYHLDLIDKGVERLSEAREGNKRVESEAYQNLIRGRGNPKELPAPVVTVTAKAK